MPTDPMAIPSSPAAPAPASDLSKPLLYGVSVVTGVVSGLVLGALAGVVMCLVTHPRVRHKNSGRHRPEREDADDDDADDE